MTAETVKTIHATKTTTAAAVPAALSATAARRLAAVERTAYGAAGILTAVGPHLGNPWLDLAAMGIGAGTLWRLWGRTQDEDPGRLLAGCGRALPVLGLSGCYTAALMAPGTSWWEIAAPLAVAAWAGLVTPWTRSRGVRRAVEELPDRIAAQEAALAPQQAAVEEAPADAFHAGLVRLWAQSAATGATTLTGIRQYTHTAPDFEAVILAPAGEAVPATLTERTVAAVFDVPVEAVSLAAVDGSGPGRLAVRVAPAAAAQQAVAEAGPEEYVRRVWEEHVAAKGGVAPGMHLAAHRLEDDRVVIRVEAAEGQMIHLPRLPLARALGVEDPELVMVETDGLATGVVTVYRQHPLITVREATVEDLRMDSSGRIAIGLRHDGRPARWPLYDPELGALTDLIVGAPGSGKSVTLLTLLAAERINGIISVVSDAQDGMSLPEAEGRVYHFGAGQAASAATLAAFSAVASYRQEISAANGWGSFTLGQPWRLAILTMDEINRMLAADAGVPGPFRKWVAGMLGAGQITWRKVGMGVRYAGQSVHLADLGDSEKIRANAKNGSVWLGRVNSSMTRSMATDMASGSVEITPIPKYFGVSGASEVEAAWSGEEAPTGPVTAGTAWLIQSGQPYLSRVWRAVKQERTYPGLIRLLESAPMPGLTSEEGEIFREVYAEALPIAEALLAGEDPNADEDGDDDEGQSRRSRNKQAQPRLSRPAMPAPPRTLADRILDALAGGPLRTREIRSAVGVGEPDGPAAGSVDNTLSKLAEAGRVVRAGHGVWALPDTD